MVPKAQTGEELVERMKAAHVPSANCYQAEDGSYFIEYAGGRVSRRLIDDALQKGLIVPAFADRPDLPYWKVRP